LSDRVGGGIGIGNAAFYQSMFLGGHGNLLGFLQNRFAGRHMVFNNLQARVKLADIASYILPGQLGLTGFYDAGRVWIKGEHSDKWHQGTGGGLYFSPAGLTVLQVLAGHSNEGWYPYISLNFRI
jgi:outer membrane translocation and assembly module TamA